MRGPAWLPSERRDAVFGLLVTALAAVRRRRR